MPFVTLLTNLKASAFSGDAMPRLVRFVAPLLNKPAERFNWVLETDKRMSKVGQMFDHIKIFLFKLNLGRS